MQQQKWCLQAALIMHNGPTHEGTRDQLHPTLNSCPPSSHWLGFSLILPPLGDFSFSFHSSLILHLPFPFPKAETGCSPHPCGEQPFLPCISHILQMSEGPRRGCWHWGEVHNTHTHRGSSSWLHLCGPHEQIGFTVPESDLCVADQSRNLFYMHKHRVLPPS